MNASQFRRNLPIPVRALLCALVFVALLLANGGTNPLNFLTELRTVENVPVGNAEDVERESLECLPDAHRPPLRHRADAQTVSARLISAPRAARSAPHVPAEGDGANGCGAPLRC